MRIDHAGFSSIETSLDDSTQVKQAKLCSSSYEQSSTRDCFELLQSDATPHCEQIFVEYEFNSAGRRTTGSMWGVEARFKNTLFNHQFRGDTFA